MVFGSVAAEVWNLPLRVCLGRDCYAVVDVPQEGCGIDETFCGEGCGIDFFSV